jgi:uncharacterized protein YdhG (YjbR/CyaY superfamily)
MNMETVGEYVDSVEAARKDTFSKILATIRANIPKGFVEEINYGMIGFDVPLQTYPQGYLDDPKKPLPYLGLASQKHYISFYHMGLYAKPGYYEWFLEQYGRVGYGHKADIGKSCVRMKYLDEIPYALIGESVKIFTVVEWIAEYERSRGKRG